MHKITLRNGQICHIREVTPNDRNAIRKGFHMLSSETVYQRFLGQKKDLNEEELDFFSNPNGLDHVALAALIETSEGLIPAGVTRFIVNRNRPETAEFGIVIVDRFQGLGLGKILLSELIKEAKARNLKKFTGQIDESNEKMLKLIKRFNGFKTVRLGRGLLELDADLTLT